MQAAGDAHDLQRISLEVEKYQDQGRELAYVGKFHGQFNFLGRLEAPVKRLPPREASSWARAHPERLLIIYDVDNQLPLEDTVYAQNYRGGRQALKILESGDYPGAAGG